MLGNRSLMLVLKLEQDLLYILHVSGEEKRNQGNGLTTRYPYGS